MVKDLYGMLLEDLGRMLKLSELQPDRNNSCMIKFANGTSCFIEPGKERPILTIAFELGTPAPGKYRENLFFDALRANGMLPPRVGYFAYSTKSGKLFLMQELLMDGIHADAVFHILTPMKEKAKEWQEAIARGEIPQLQFSTRYAPSGMFGLK